MFGRLTCCKYLQIHPDIYSIYQTLYRPMVFVRWILSNLEEFLSRSWWLWGQRTLVKLNFFPFQSLKATNHSTFSQYNLSSFCWASCSVIYSFSFHFFVESVKCCIQPAGVWKGAIWSWGYLKFPFRTMERFGATPRFRSAHLSQCVT